MNGSTSFFKGFMGKLVESPSSAVMTRKSLNENDARMAAAQASTV